MNVRTRSLAAALLGLAAGIAWNAASTKPITSTESTENPHTSPARPTTHPRSPSAFTKRASTLTRTEWPAFFRSQLNSPENSRLAARLWAEADPQSFWKWLRDERDPYLIDRFALDLLTVWTSTDPERALDAALQITRKEIGDRLRQAVVETALEQDLQKGLELASRAGKFRFSLYQTLPWITRNPASTTIGLASLPSNSEFRHYLHFAINAWFDQDPAAAFEWLKSNKEPLTHEVTSQSFTAAAKFNPLAALDAAQKLQDPTKRNAALSGIIAAATLDPASSATLISQLPISLRSSTAKQMIESRPAQFLTELNTNAAILQQLPSGSKTIDAVKALAEQWGKTSPSTAWQWAATLPDPASRRSAYAQLVWSLPPDQPPSIHTIPLSDLSNELFTNIYNRTPNPEIRQKWINQLPPEHAAWAKSLYPP
jgi:hypothetical protein